MSATLERLQALAKILAHTHGGVKLGYIKSTIIEESGLLVADIHALAATMTKGVPMLLFCPRCQQQHIDKSAPVPGWDNPPHATHTCAGCELLWRPSNVNTTGIAMLPAEEPKHLERIRASYPRLHPQGVDIPICGPHAEIWFCERNHLKGDHRCIVCAFK